MHTISTISDSYFEFSLEKLKEYVKAAELDAIAITNHDIFDLAQFNEICEALNCVVFPGIEINLDAGHLLLISENHDLEGFQLKANEVAKNVVAIGDSINVDDLMRIFGDLNNYLLIPH